MLKNDMDKQLLEETIAYLRRELAGVCHDLTWADGVQAEAFQLRRDRLLAELNRLESLRCMPSTADKI